MKCYEVVLYTDDVQLLYLWSILIGTYYYFLLNTDDIKYTIKTHQDLKFMYVCMYVLYVQEVFLIVIF